MPGLQSLTIGESALSVTSPVAGSSQNSGSVIGYGYGLVGNAPVHLAFRYCQSVKRINNAFARIMYLIVQVLIRSSHQKSSENKPGHSHFVLLIAV